MAAMLTLLYSEKVSKAYRMLRVREKLQGLSPAMEHFYRIFLPSEVRPAITNLVKTDQQSGKWISFWKNIRTILPF